MCLALAGFGTCMRRMNLIDGGGMGRQFPAGKVMPRGRLDLLELNDSNCLHIGSGCNYRTIHAWNHEQLCHYSRGWHAVQNILPGAPTPSPA